MNYVSSIPAEHLKIGTVFYAEGYGYVVVVLLAGSKLIKAYTSYGRPMVLLREDEEQEYRVYPQLNGGKDTSTSAQYEGKILGEIQTNSKGDDIVIDEDGEYIGIITSAGDYDIILRNNEVIYEGVERVVNIDLGEPCEQVEYEETGKALSIEIVDDWQEQLGTNTEVKLKNILIEVLNNTLHSNQLIREDRKWLDEVVRFRNLQKPTRVNGKMFKPRASRFICGFIREEVQYLYFMKKITDVVYRVSLDIEHPENDYIIEECDDNILRGEIQEAVRDKYLPLAVYDLLFGKRSTRTVQVSGLVPVDIQERMKWGGYTLPQVIQAGVQALEDGESNIDYSNIPNIVKGYTDVDSARQLFRIVLMGEDY